MGQSGPVWGLGDPKSAVPLVSSESHGGIPHYWMVFHRLILWFIMVNSGLMMGDFINGNIPSSLDGLSWTIPSFEMDDDWA